MPAPELLQESLWLLLRQGESEQERFKALQTHLRGRIRLQADGGLKTGLDVIKGAILRAQSFGFGTIPLVALGCMALFVIAEGVLWQALGLSLLVALYLASWSAQGSRVWRDLLFSCAGLGAARVLVCCSCSSCVGGFPSPAIE